MVELDQELGAPGGEGSSQFEISGTGQVFAAAINLSAALRPAALGRSSRRPAHQVLGDQPRRGQLVVGVAGSERDLEPGDLLAAEPVRAAAKDAPGAEQRVVAATSVAAWATTCAWRPKLMSRSRRSSIAASLRSSSIDSSGGTAGACCRSGNAGPLHSSKAARKLCDTAARSPCAHPLTTITDQLLEQEEIDLICRHEQAVSATNPTDPVLCASTPSRRPRLDENVRDIHHLQNEPADSRGPQNPKRMSGWSNGMTAFAW